MQFANPGFLWAYLAVLIPLFIHLFNFRKYRLQEFSNVNLLKNIQTESKKVRQVKKWLILLSRMMMILSLVTAFAQPYIPSENSKTGSSIGLYIDNSFSMNVEGKEGQLFEMAKEDARKILRSSPSNVRFQIANNSYISREFIEKEKALDLIDNMVIDHQVNDIQNSLKDMVLLAKQNGFVQHTVCVLSDLQKTVEVEPWKLDEGVDLNVIRLSPEGMNNISVDSVWLESPVFRLGEEARIRVLVTNHGEQLIEGTDLQFRINGTSRGALSFDIGPNRAEKLELNFIIRDTLYQACEIEISDPELSFDNTYYFGFEVHSRFNILEVSEEPSSLKKITGSDPMFTHVVLPPGSVQFSAFADQDVVVLNSVSNLSEGLIQELRRYVENGGQLLYFPPDDLNNANQQLTGFGLAEFKGASGGEVTVDGLSLDMDFYSGVYRSIPESAIWPMFMKWYDMTEWPGHALVKLKNGANIFKMQDVGKGRLFQYAFPTDDSWSDYSKHELFVLSFLQVVFTKPLNYKLAYPLTYSGPIKVNSFLEQGASLSKGEFTSIVEMGESGADRFFWLNQEIAEDGFYALKLSESDSKQYALNYDRRESRQEYYTLNELLFNSSDVAGEIEIDALMDDLREGEARTYWKLFVIFSLIFLLIEILLLRFIKS